MIKNIRHTGLVVNDLSQALAFWCDLLGFKLLKQIEESGRQIDAILDLNDVSVTTVKLRSPDGQQLELLKFNSHPDRVSWQGRPYSTGLTHIAVTVENMENAVEKLSNHGVRFPNAPQLSPDGSVSVTYAIGPENILLEIVEELV
jgi:catechol 2,3-dioxygenase-like lactoylglutathione lyase family enzyme